MCLERDHAIDKMLTYTDAPCLPPPTSGGLSSEQLAVERTRACTQLSFQAMIPACPCRSCTRYAALGDADARYSWSHTARSSHACHRHHPRKTLPNERLLKIRGREYKPMNAGRVCRRRFFEHVREGVKLFVVASNNTRKRKRKKRKL